MNRNEQLNLALKCDIDEAKITISIGDSFVQATITPETAIKLADRIYSNYKAGRN